MTEIAAEIETPDEAPDAPDLKGAPVAFGITWLSYASYYLGRKWLGVTKVALEQAFGESALYGVETMYLASYAVGQGVAASLGDKLGARVILGAGMLLSAAACVAFGFSTGIVLFLITMLVNGLAQATGWPGNVKAMGEWTPPSRRGAVMGLWTTCYTVGGIAASFIAGRLLKSHGFRLAIVLPAVAMGLVGVLVLLFLKPGPLGNRKAPGAAALSPEDEAAEKTANAEARAKVLRSPLVWSYGASYFFIKLTRYSLLFWLPKYLQVGLGYEPERAAYFSTSFEIGGIAGAVALGLLSDRFRKVPRPAFAAASLVGLAAAFYLYLRVGGLGPEANFLSMALIGVLLYGPDALLSGAAAQDAGGPRAAALAAGMVNGLGSLGGIAQELVTRQVSDRWGWSALFWVFLALALFAALSLAPTLRRRPPSPALSKAERVG